MTSRYFSSSRERSARSRSGRAESVMSTGTSGLSLNTPNLTSARNTPSRLNYTLNNNDTILCAITEGKGVAPVVGICFVFLNTGECILCEVSDSQTYVRTLQKIYTFEPSLIILPEMKLASHQSKLPSVLERSLETNTKIVYAARTSFNEAAGWDFVSRFCFVDTIESLKVALTSKFYSLCCLAAATGYVRNATGSVFLPYSVPITFQSGEGTMAIDFRTTQSLELIQNRTDAKSKQCLLGIIDQTLTSMGRRMLRSSLLQPLTDIHTIELRLDAQEELMHKDSLFFNCRDALHKFTDFDRLLAAMVTVPASSNLKSMEQGLNNIIALKQCLLQVSALENMLNSADSVLLSAIGELSRDDHVIEIMRLISETIHQDCVWAKTPLELRNQRSYAILQGANGLLDVARKVSQEATEDIHSYISKLLEECQLDAAETRFDNQRGYYLRIGVDQQGMLSDVVINRKKRGRFVEFTTMELVKLNKRQEEASNEVLLLSDSIVQEIAGEIRSKHLCSLFKISEGVALLDMICGLVQVASSSGPDGGYIRPTFVEDNYPLIIKSGRHPVRERIEKNRRIYIANDVHFNSNCRVEIISGVNMSGKTTFLTQVGLLIIMAQLGSFIPASSAQLPIYDNILSCMTIDCCDEDLRLSSFANEMQQAAYIINNMNSKSLVLIDELGRGTSIRDGLAISLAICQSLCNGPKSVLFTTHFQLLSQVMCQYDGVQCLHLATELTNANRQDEIIQMSMLYKVQDGSSNQVHYGLDLASLAGFPNEILKRAREVSLQLSNDAGNSNLIAKHKAILKIRDSLLLTNANQLSDDALISLLKIIQKSFINQMEPLV